MQILVEFSKIVHLLDLDEILDLLYSRLLEMVFGQGRHHPSYFLAHRFLVDRTRVVQRILNHGEDAALKIAVQISCFDFYVLVGLGLRSNAIKIGWS